MRLSYIIAATAFFLASCGQTPVIQPDPKFATATPVTENDLIAAKKSISSLEAALTNTTHYYYTENNDTQVRYLGAGGKAVFLVENGTRVVSGEWRVKDNFTNYYICISPGILFERNIDQDCFLSAKTFYAAVQHLVKGDVMGLQKKLK